MLYLKFKSAISWVMLVAIIATQTGVGVVAAAQVPDDEGDVGVVEHPATVEQVVEPESETSVSNEEVPVGEASATDPDLEYSDLMDKVEDVRRNADSVSEDSKVELEGAFDGFIASEVKKLQELGVEQKRIDEYVELLKFQQEHLDEDVVEKGEPGDLKMTDNPSSFSFGEDDVEVGKLEDVEEFSPWADLSEVLPAEAEEKGLADGLKDLFIIEDAGAALNQNDFPKLADLSEDDEAVIDQVIKDKAQELGSNPVEIYEFVRSNVEYEPYFGAKKGAVGCLREKVCNDVDSASLTVALLRASGIPARYKKSIIVVPVEKLKEVLGVDENKTAYAALAINDVPVFLVSGNALNGTSLDAADLTGEKEFAVQWIFPEAFYEYDERGANINNEQDFSDATTDAELKTDLQAYPKKQWIPMDVIFKSYTRTKKDILVDTAQMNVEQFWTDYFKYQGTLSPLEKYEADLLSSTGKKVDDYLSTNVGGTETVDFIPHSMPFVLATGTYDGGTIAPEALSNLDDRFRTKVKISLLKESDKSVVLTKTFYGSEVNNVPVNLYYEGATQTDKNTIDSYGGIHKTPAGLVKVRAYLLGDEFRVNGTVDVGIGDGLILQSQFISKGVVDITSEKFSTAGNTEGIFVVLSKVAEIQGYNDDSKIVFSGTPFIAREYIKRIEEGVSKLQNSLEYRYNNRFVVVVVTQSRLLQRVNGIPTDFDMKGLKIDSNFYIEDYSSRGSYKNHRKDFRQIYGQYASYYEGQLFDDLTGLEGISTTKGLQYAYSKPTEYTVYTITSANKSVIDTLSFSTNTKNNMKTDVDNGNTIITPNKPVTNKNWKGLFYVSRKSDGDGLYAIGEQVAGNGGDTINILQTQTVNYSYNKPDGTLVAAAGDLYLWDSIVESIFFSYQDSPNPEDSTVCRIGYAEKADFEKSVSGWDIKKHGAPCVIGTDMYFGGYYHRYALATNAVKFYSPNRYNYWTYFSDINSTLSKYIDDKKALPSSDKDYIEDGEKLKIAFSIDNVGTYRRTIRERPVNYWPDDYASVYYVPGQDSQGNPAPKVFRVKDHFYDKYVEDGSLPARRIGFPTSDENYAADSNVGGEVFSGKYQDFVNGQIYKHMHYKLWWTYYTYNPITAFHNIHGGTRDPNLGFPTGDPLDGSNNTVYQVFQNGNEVVWDKSQGSGANAVSRVSERKFRCETYGWIGEYNPLNLVITTKGLLDTLANTASDAYEIAKKIGYSILNFGETLDQLADTYESIKLAVSQLDFYSLWDSFKDVAGASLTALKTEMEQSYCPARRSYIKGRILGEIALIAIPASKLTAVTKVKLLARAKAALKGVSLFSKIEHWGRVMKLVNKVDIDDLKVIRAITDSNSKGYEGEQFMKRIVGNYQHFDQFTKGGDKRVVDLWDDNLNIAHEVKTVKDPVSYSGDIKEQVRKDIELMNELGPDEYKPVWHFLEAGPTQPLKDALEESGIEYIIYKTDNF